MTKTTAPGVEDSPPAFITDAIDCEMFSSIADGTVVSDILGLMSLRADDDAGSWVFVVLRVTGTTNNTSSVINDTSLHWIITHEACFNTKTTIFDSNMHLSWQKFGQ